jgi:hypothetical protein
MDQEKSNQRPLSFKVAIRSSWFWKPVGGALAGGLAGFLYYYYIGCSSGTCAITSNPYMSVLFGAALGYYALNSSCGSKC